MVSRLSSSTRESVMVSLSVEDPMTMKARVRGEMCRRLSATGRAGCRFAASTGRLFAAQSSPHDCPRAPDARPHIHCLGRTILRAGPALHAGIPIRDLRLSPVCRLNSKNAVGADFHASAAPRAPHRIEVEGNYVSQILLSHVASPFTVSPKPGPLPCRVEARTLNRLTRRMRGALSSSPGPRRITMCRSRPR